MVAPTVAKLSSTWNTARHASNGWPIFLSSVAVDGLRGWSGETVEFRYPVVAIAGVNGAGKSTILKAAAAAYQAPSGNDSTTETYTADEFFPKTPWEDVTGVALTYAIRQGDQSETITLRKATSRWRGGPDRKRRPSYFLDISRIQPANTQIGYGRTAQEVISRGSTEPLTDDEVAQVSRTLGRTYEAAGFDRNQDKQVGVLTHSGVRYSNFHQGAGEDSVLDLLVLLSKAPNRSLIVIDELEASLHPRAQRTLMTELIHLAEKKKLQVILSTHSPYVLEQLPSIARVFISVDRQMKRQVLYGVSAAFSLSLMDTERHHEVEVYCEDEESQYVVERLLAVGAPKQLKRVRITPVGPASTVMTLGQVASKGNLPLPSICVVDAEQLPGKHYILLPGKDAPEKELFGALSEANWETVAERLGRSAGELLDAKEKAVVIDNHHAWSGRVAKELGGTIRPSKVWEAIADVWVRDVIGEDGAKKWCKPIKRMVRSLTDD